ncbi:hypothetical protein [Halomonas denitrificans]|nr:hypothetical protein [Halomonas denitrificans]
MSIAPLLERSAWPRLLLAALVLGAAGSVRAEGPDLERALALRDLEPIRAWLADAPEPTAAAWRARIALARIESPNEVKDLLDAARADHPDDAGLVLQQAATALEALDARDGRFERMREARAVGRLLERALDLDPNHPEALAAAIGFHRDVPRIAGGREDRVPALVARLAEVDPARAAQVESETARQTGREAAALEAIERAVLLDPLRRPGWRVQRAAALGRVGRIEAAVAHLETVIADAPAYGPAWFQLGRWIAAGGGAAERGIEALERYLLMPGWPGDPSTAEALVRMATLKTRAGDADGARRALEQARILDAGLFADDGANSVR